METEPKPASSVQLAPPSTLGPVEIPTRAGRLGLADLQRWAPILVFVAGAALPLALSSGFELNRYELLFTYITVALALNFAFGFAGELALSQPVLVAVSAYTAGILSVRLHWDIWQTLIPGVAAALIVGIVLGLPSLRVRGWYYAMLSFFGIAIMPDVITAFDAYTGGEDGLIGIRSMVIGGVVLSRWMVYEVIFVTAVLTWIAIRSLVGSDWGIALRTMRDHPVAAISSGLNLDAMRARVYLLMALPCGLVGVEYAHANQYLTPSTFQFAMLLLLIGSVFLGGVATYWGPVLGMVIFQGISLWIGPFSSFNQLALGLGVLVTAVGFKGGIVAASRRAASYARKRFAREREPAAEEVSLASPDPTDLDPIAGDVGLVVKSAKKQFGGNVVLDGVDLDVRGGQILALIGPNGSGKTTLLNVVSGFVDLDSGNVVLNGADVAQMKPEARGRAGLGRTFQVPQLVNELTVLENVKMGLIGRERQSTLAALLRLPGYRRRSRLDTDRASRVCQLLGFDKTAMHVPARNLSLGLKRIVEVGRALAAGVSVVCLDEPAAGLNAAERERLAGVLRALAKAGRAVLLVEHNTEFVLGVCDEIVLLKDGRVAGRGKPPQLTDPALREYIGAYAV